MRRVQWLAGSLFALLVWILPAAPALAGPGDLDASFGDGGKATFNLGTTNGTEGIVGVGLQPDGKIVATGQLDVGDDLATIRVLPDGSQDTSFGGTGDFSRLHFTGGNAENLAVQPDGKVVLISTTSGGPSGQRFVVARLTSQGLLDASFDATGTPGFLISKFTSLSTSGAVDIPFGVALQGDSIIVMGESSLTDPAGFDFAASRVTSDGSLDNGFGGNGGTFVDFVHNQQDRGFGVAVQPDGKIVLVGQTGAGAIGVVRLLPEGGLDSGFGSGGKTTIAGDIAFDVAIQPDGKIVIVGGGSGDAIVARLKADGSPDNSFGGDGRTAVDFGGSQDGGRGVVLQPDGKVVISGTMSTGSAAQMAAARLQPNGTLDDTFGTKGIVLVKSSGGDLANDLVRQPDGKVVLAGFSGAFRDPVFPPQGDFALVRLQGDPGGAVKKAKCGGRKATIIGTKGRDKLKGTKKRDVIAGLGGKDTLKGLKGNDLICGGGGKDKLIGGPGKDKLLGQGGNDKLLGGGGKDTLKGGPGKHDKLKGGPGKDVQKP